MSKPSRSTANTGVATAARIVIPLLGISLVSQAWVQTVSAGKTVERAKASKRFYVSQREVARRGSILSSDGKPLAQDEPSAEFGILFEKVPKASAFWVDLSRASGIPASEFSSLAEAGVKRRFWRDRMAPDRIAAIQEVRKRWRADGISLERSGSRRFGLGPAASGIVGYFLDGAPQGGIELSKSEILAGKDGKTVGLVDRTGDFLPMRLDKETVAKQDGKDIVLTIDSELQREASIALTDAVERHKADRGVAIIVDPKTGDILAMANAPTLSVDLTTGKKSGSDFNAAYRSALEPGSTFKILTLALALDEGKTTMDETLHCGGSMRVWDDHSIHCDAHGGSRAHGAIQPVMAIAKSCNVCAATWALRIGYDKFVHNLEALGLLERSNLGLPYERGGRFNRDEYAKKLQLATVGFGQSIAATPVALANAYSMLANDGLRMKPRLIKKIGGDSIAIERGPQVIRPETAQNVLKAMEAVIETDSGTGKKLRIPGYRLAGKTGTAEKVGSAKGEKAYVSNFVGFVPAKNPRAVILVMIDHPKVGGYYGGSVAGPVFLEIARSVIRRYGIPQTETVSSAPEKSPIKLLPKPKSASQQEKP